MKRLFEIKEQEVWRDIDNYAGMYQVSNLGNVKSLERKVFNPGLGKFQHLKGRLLKLTGGGTYVQVILCKNGNIKAHLVHRLVAEAFIPNPNNYPIINHKDENPKNNCVENLEWCTYKYNNEYNGRIEKCKNKISATLTGRKVNRILTDAQRKNISDGAKRGWEKRRKSSILSKESI